VGDADYFRGGSRGFGNGFGVLFHGIDGPRRLQFLSRETNLRCGARDQLGAKILNELLVEYLGR
jgi:hypothetical protein